MKIDMWLTRSGAYISHSQGLTVDHINALRALQPGDRLVVYMNETTEDNRPPMTIRKLVVKAEKE